MRAAATTALLLAVAAPLHGQLPDAGPDAVIDAATRARVIGGVLGRLEEGYVFPEKATAMSRAVRERARAGAYDRVSSARAFADSLTEHLRAVSHDRHLRVVYRRDGLPDQPPDAEPSAEERRREVEFGRQVNYGLERAERLPGNVGYLEIRSFNFEAAAVDSALAAAMNFLSGTDALIIDVRRNGGGDPNMVAAVCSYLMPAGTLINRFYRRKGELWEEFRTGTPSGRHYGTERPVYVLTSDDTFSGAEEFAYDIQTQRRGRIVGDTTGGGANPGGMRRVSDGFGVWVPTGRAVNPVTGTNWEGVGVRPDVPVPAADALREAHRLVLEAMLATERDAARRALLQQALDDLRPASAT
ncbi:MAG TPA: S41 family peptidase [Gemmatimonadales bacterium]|nr:S41 family peptidase [Gemmatimonadales bacterium]